jgi:methionyl-tRNA formyltransferase
MRIIFMGSAPLACPSLEAILGARASGSRNANDVAGVVSQPDRPSGRRLRVSPCAVKVAALNASVPVLTPEDINAPESVSAVRNLKPDLIVVVAYGKILKPAVLSIPPLGCINLHASLLPAFRGAAPIQWAVARGENVTGVTTLYMDERMDAGDIIFQCRSPILPSDTAGTLHDRLAEEGAALLLRTLAAVGSGTAPRVPQDESAATYAPKLHKRDGRIDWTLPAREIHNRIRGFNPWPCCFCKTGKRMLRVLWATMESTEGEAGEILDVSDGPLVGTGAGSLRLTRVQPEGGKAMSAAAYLNGHPMTPGQRLG